MIRLLQYAVILWGSAAYSFHLQPELKPLWNPDVNSISVQSHSSDGKMIKTRLVEVEKRDEQGLPIVFKESWHFACAKCLKARSACSCSTSTLPSPIRNDSPSAQRKRDEALHLQQSLFPPHEGSSLLPAEPAGSRTVSRNRCMQALAACISFPCLLGIACSQSDEVEVNACYDEHVLPHTLSEDLRDSDCCHCMFMFCPCCVPQEEQ